MNPRLIAKRYETYNDDGTLVNPELLEEIQKECTHEVAFEKEGYLELSEYECMLCEKKMGGYFDKDRLPDDAFVVYCHPLSNIKDLFDELIEFIVIINLDQEVCDIKQIVEGLYPKIEELSELMLKDKYNKNNDLKRRL